MAIRNELGIPVTSIVQNRLLHATKTRSGIGANVLKSQRFDDIDHVIGPTTVGRQHFDFKACRRRRCSLLCSHRSRLNDCSGTRNHAALEEFSSLHISLLRHAILSLKSSAVIVTAARYRACASRTAATAVAVMIYDCR